MYYKAILSFQALLVAQYGGTLIVITMFNCWLCWFYDSNRPHLLFQRSKSCLAAFHLNCSLSTTLFLPKQTWQHQGWKQACYTAQQSQRLALNRSLWTGLVIARVSLNTLKGENGSVGFRILCTMTLLLLSQGLSQRQGLLRSTKIVYM